MKLRDGEEETERGPRDGNRAPSWSFIWKAMRGFPGICGTALKKKMLGVLWWSQSPGWGLGETPIVPLSWRWPFALGARTKLPGHWHFCHT